MTPKNYLSQLFSLLPRGPAWPRNPDSIIGRLLLAVADMFARIDARTRSMIDEADPRTTTWLLPLFEKMLGLPEPCVTMSGISQSIEQRRAAVVARLTEIGGASKRFFIFLAKKMGYPNAVIDTYRPMTCNDDCNDALWSQGDRWTWQIAVPYDDAGVFVATCNSDCNTPLQTWGDVGFECFIEQIKPTETTVIFAYPKNLGDNNDETH